MDTQADLRLLSGVLAHCSDCGGEQILVPVDSSGEFCCTVCDAAVYRWAARALPEQPHPYDVPGLRTA